ncbi:sugar-binding transcriptional regulator [Specibacter cremeus]|uniref:sugar-binding transcriptional regulator n=1 Tax=Specibacter cremeus TaxID=1629051 RepID=UPI000F798F30|nr:sugar-binding domain-containing protein [Specibacter cremeus]
MALDDAARHDLLVQRVAHRYYIGGANQGEIAGAENLSRASVSRLLAEAKRRGVVQIHIGPPVDRMPALEKTMRERFDLVDCVIAMDRPRSLYAKNNRLGYVAARYLESHLDGVRQLGVAASRTLSSVAKALGPGSNPELTVIDLLACPSRLDRSGDERIHVGEHIAQQLGAGFIPLPANFMFRDPALRDRAMAIPEVGESLALGVQSDLALLGLGSMQRFDGTGTYSPLSPSALAELESRGAAAHLCGHFFDADGRPMASELSERLIGITLPDLLRIPRRLMVTAGPAKVVPLAAAIRGRYVNELVTEEATARALLEHVGG